MGMCLPVIELLSPTEIPCLCEYGGGGATFWQRVRIRGIPLMLPTSGTQLIMKERLSFLSHSFGANWTTWQLPSRCPGTIRCLACAHDMMKLFGKTKAKKRKKKKKEYLCPSLSLRLLVISRQSGYGDLWCLPRMQQQHWRYLLL